MSLNKLAITSIHRMLLLLIRGLAPLTTQQQTSPNIQRGGAVWTQNDDNDDDKSSQHVKYPGDRRSIFLLVTLHRGGSVVPGNERNAPRQIEIFDSGFVEVSPKSTTLHSTPPPPLRLPPTITRPLPPPLLIKIFRPQCTNE